MRLTAESHTQHLFGSLESFKSEHKKYYHYKFKKHFSVHQKKKIFNSSLISKLGTQIQSFHTAKNQVSVIILHQHSK